MAGKSMELFSGEGTGPPEKAIPPDRTAGPWMPRKNKSTCRADVGKSHYEVMRIELRRFYFTKLEEQGELPERSLKLNAVKNYPRGPVD